MAKQPKKPLCIVCGNACESSDRNSDGTYAHRECLYANMTQPIRRPK